MKAITVLQPWASLIACGLKQYETRSWRTSHRGEIAIHAAKSRPIGTWAFLGMDLAEEAYDRLGGIRDLPLGKVVAIAELVDIEMPLVSDWERRMGDFREGMYAWRMKVLRVLDPPVPARGRQRLWNLDQKL